MTVERNLEEVERQLGQLVRDTSERITNALGEATKSAEAAGVPSDIIVSGHLVSLAGALRAFIEAAPPAHQPPMVMAALETLGAQLIGPAAIERVKQGRAQIFDLLHKGRA
jgi:hypothetical protein